MSALDALRGLDFNDRTTQVVAIAGVGIAGYVILSSRKDAGTSGARATAADAIRNATPDNSGLDVPAGNSQNYPGWVGYPDLPSTNPTTSTPPPATPPPANQGACDSGKVAIWRNGKLTCMAASTNAAQKCPPGYAPVKSSAGTRCAKVNEWGNTPGPTSFVPVDLAGTYQKGYRGMSQPSPAGAAGQAFLDGWLGRGAGGGPNPYGSVRSFSPHPAPVAAGSVTVGKGDTLASLSRRLYGTPDFWPRLVQRNGTAAANLTVGDTIRG